MSLARTSAYTSARYHYARLFLTPLDPSSPPADPVTVLELVDKVLVEWYGSMGAIGARGEVHVVSLHPRDQTAAASRAHATRDEDIRGDDLVRDVILRFPAGATHPVLTSLALAPSCSLSGHAYALRLLNDSGDLQRLTGLPGSGRTGYESWVAGLSAKAETKEEMVLG
ncbi:hypothetical protein JCM11641_006046 [Rhodosporidiobolus odoratus]